MTDAELLASFENAPGVLRRALVGLTHEQLHARPIEGKWSTHDVAIHLADADAAFIHRLKRIIAEEHPTYHGWSETAFITNLVYHEQLAEDAVQLIEVNHRQFARVMKALPAGWLERTGVHSERGVQTARDVLQYASWHISHHLKFVAEKKAKLGI